MNTFPWFKFLIRSQEKLTIFLRRTLVFLTTAGINDGVNMRFHSSSVKMLGNCLECAIDSWLAENFVIPTDDIVEVSIWKYNYIMIENMNVVLNSSNRVFRRMLALL